MNGETLFVGQEMMANRLKHPAQGRTGWGIGMRDANEFVPFAFLAAEKFINKLVGKPTSRDIYRRTTVVGFRVGFDEENSGRSMEI